MDEININNPEALMIVCYPLRESTLRECLDRIRRLEAYSVESLCSYGSSILPRSRVRVLGKGHAGVVSLAYSRRLGIVAIKARRLDSKRSSLIGEALMLSKASIAGVAPRVYYFDNDLIVMEAVLGPSLEQLIEDYGLTKRIIIETIEVARILDVIGILHHELNRPWRNIIFTCDNPYCKALVVDLESASSRCGNLPLLLGGLAGRSEIIKEIVSENRAILREYSVSGCSREMYEKLKSVILRSLEK